MDFIALQPFVPTWGILIVAMVFLAVGGVCLVFGIARGRQAAVVASCLCAVAALFFTVAFGAVGLDGRDDVRDARVADTIEEQYGLGLADEQKRKLNYPDSEPNGPQVFGTAEGWFVGADGAVLTVSVTLAYDGERFLLQRQDADGVSELDTPDGGVRTIGPR